MPDVVIVPGRCAHARAGFGIRFELMNTSQWMADWCFALSDDRAMRERYGERQIAGLFVFAPTFPGCPHCGAGSIYKCACGKVNCWNGMARVVTCDWCGGRGTLQGTVDSLFTNRDR